MARKQNTTDRRRQQTADKESSETKSRKERIRDVLSKIEEKLKNEAPNATLADFIRLTQLERELEQEEQPGEVIVRWQEPSEKPSLER